MYFNFMHLCTTPAGICSRLYFLPDVWLIALRIGISICARHVPSEDNPAHGIDKHEQARRRKDDWQPDADVWPDYMDHSWISVFEDVSRNQALVSDVHVLSSEVLASLSTSIELPRAYVN